MIYGYISFGGSFIETSKTERGAKAAATRNSAILVGYRSSINNMFIETAEKINGVWVKKD